MPAQAYSERKKAPPGVQESGSKRPGRQRAPVTSGVWPRLALSVIGQHPALQRACACDDANAGCACPEMQDKRMDRALVQPSLAISTPGDPSEREADRIADEVMRMPEGPVTGPQVQEFKECGTVNRACASCAAHDGAGDELPAGDDLSSVVARGTSGGGQSLDVGTRAFMESRFDRAFGHVRVHTGSDAGESARSINAIAYTVGSDIVFGAGGFQPQTTSGRRLLAHELTHVMQQRGSRPRLHRQTDDFRVTQVQPDPEQRTRGMAARFFFEIDQSDFREEVPAEAAERTRLESWATAHAAQHVSLVGRASQEGSQPHNRALAQRRIDTVRKVLAAQGAIIDGTPQIDMTFSERPVDYRFYRSVEVIVAGSADTTCSAFTGAQQSSDEMDCETAFKAAHARAIDIANAGIDRLRPAADPAPTPAPDRDTILNERFPGVSRATVLPRFESVITRLGEVGSATGHVCKHRCAPDCERAARATTGVPVELCAPFYIPGFRGQTLSVNRRVYTVMHETTHSAVVPGSSPAEGVGIDVAYARARLFGVLEGSEALRNADSYVMTLLALARTTGGAPAIIAEVGIGPADTFRLTTPAGEPGDRNRTARRAIGFAESWLNYAAFWSPELYDFIAASLATWSPSGLADNGHSMLELFAPLFQLQHPGAALLDPDKRPVIAAFQAEVAGRGFPTPATSSHAQVQDRTRAAGIYDRFSRMLERLRGPLVVDRAAIGDGSWATAPGLPGLGSEVRLADTFFSLSPAEQSRHVIRLMARAMADVGTALVEAYVEAADGVHRHHNLGP